jgi:hypothetical protein
MTTARVPTAVVSWPMATLPAWSCAPGEMTIDGLFERSRRRAPTLADHARRCAYFFTILKFSTARGQKLLRSLGALLVENAAARKPLSNRYGPPTLPCY